ncbi:MAG: hypothetical protein QNL24_10320 [Akkermansiaceae bacterium]
MILALALLLGSFSSAYYAAMRNTSSKIDPVLKKIRDQTLEILHQEKCPTGTIKPPLGHR